MKGGDFVMSAINNTWNRIKDSPKCGHADGHGAYFLEKKEAENISIIVLNSTFKKAFELQGESGNSWMSKIHGRTQTKPSPWSKSHLVRFISYSIIYRSNQKLVSTKSRRSFFIALIRKIPLKWLIRCNRKQFYRIYLPVGFTFLGFFLKKYMW